MPCFNFFIDFSSFSAEPLLDKFLTLLLIPLVGLLLGFLIAVLANFAGLFYDVPLTSIVNILCFTLIPVILFFTIGQSRIESYSENNPEESHTVAQLVWITGRGNRYHAVPDCSGMQNPYQVDLDEAVDMGLSPCKKCYP